MPARVPYHGMPGDTVIKSVKQAERQEKIRHGGRLIRNNQAIDLVEFRNPTHKQRAGARLPACCDASPWAKEAADGLPSALRER